jgi:hypothetical protein
LERPEATVNLPHRYNYWHSGDNKVPWFCEGTQEVNSGVVESAWAIGRRHPGSSFDVLTRLWGKVRKNEIKNEYA